MTTSSASVSAKDRVLTGLAADTKPTHDVEATTKFVETDTGSVYEYSGSSWIEITTAGAANTEPNALAHERNIGTSNQYGVGVPECNATILNGVGTAQTISTEPVLLFKVHLHTALTGTLTITGINNLAGTPTNYVIPIGTSGTIDFKGAKFNTTLSMTKSVGADNVLVLWRDQ